MMKPKKQYFNQVMITYSKIRKRVILEKKLSQESKLVKSDSILVLREFEKLGD